MSAVNMAVVVGACLCAGCMVACALLAWFSRRARAQRRIVALGTPAAEGRDAARGTRQWALGYAQSVTRRLFAGTTEAISPSVRAKRAGKTRAGAAYLKRAALAGCSKEVSVSG